MDGNYKSYSYTTSNDRIDAILNQPTGQFVEEDSLPDRDKLTFTNGFYGNCSALYVDIRDSSKLTATYKRPRLAKIYRAFISEMVAVLNSESRVREVSIVGDCVWAVYNTPYQRDINDVFTVAAFANTMMNLLNAKMKKKGYTTPIRAGIGVDYGRALMIKAGYSGSGINDVIYMGDVVNHAAHLAHEAGRNIWSFDPIWVGETFASNLNDHNQGLLTSQYRTDLGSYRHGHVTMTAMDEWITEKFG